MRRILVLTLCLGLASTAALFPSPSLDFEEIELANGLRVLTEARSSALLTEALLMIEAGSAYDGLAPGTAAWAAEALLAGPVPGRNGRVRQHLERAGVTAEVSVGRRQVVLHLQMPPATATATLKLLTSLLARPTLPPETWAEAADRRDMALARETYDPWLQGNALLEELAWRKEPVAGIAGSAAADEARSDSEAERPEAFRRRHYSARRMVLCLWGAVPNTLRAESQHAASLQ